MKKKRTIRRKTTSSTGIFAKALVKVDNTTRRAILKPGELKEWLTFTKTFSKRNRSSDALAKVMRSTVKDNAAYAARKKR